MRRVLIPALVLVTLALPAAADFVLQPGDYNKARIIVAEPADDIPRFAAEELQLHLKLITGHEFAIEVRDDTACRRCFVIGEPVPTDKEPLLEEEGRYAVTDKAVWLYGRDLMRVSGSTPRAAVVSNGAMRHNHVGTVFAVYMFLEQQLGVRWLEPGAEGTVAPPRKSLRLQPSKDSWQSPFPYQRNLRSYAWRRAHEPAVFLPKAFEMSQAQGSEKRAELDHWLRRMRMGARDQLNYGHAFHDWWEPYGESHPEYFALNGNGVRGPLNRDSADRVKMCVSNPGLVQQAVADWLEDRERAPLSYQALCMAQNDGGGGGSAEYCHCDACLALDVRREDEPFGQHLTDRYMYMANEALRAARKVVPGALVTAYAYSVTEEPPRRERIEDGIVLQFVTSMSAPTQETRATYEGWKDMGASRFMFRPNDLCIELGLPLGHEQRIWAHQQMAVSYGAQGTDHDSVYGLWTGVSGLVYYVLARSHIEPDKPFDYWVREYAATFGAAAPQVEAYFAHWRRKFDDTILPANGDVRSDGGRGFLRWNGLGGVSTRIRQFYDEGDFDVTDSLLAAAAAQDLTAGEHRRLERLQLGNRHNRLTFEAMSAVNKADPGLIREKASALLAYRERVRDDLRMNWRVLFSTQHRMGDATGITSLLIEPRVAGRRAFDASRTATAPVIDGKLDEALWAGARVALGLADNATAGTPKAATSAYLAWDDEALYIGLDCAEPLMADVLESVAVEKRDGPAWTDNAVEVFIDGASTGTDFHQLILTSAGALLDGRKTGDNFSSAFDFADDDLIYAVSRHDGGWRAELRLAWTGLQIDRPAAGSTLRFNLTRDRNVAVAGESEASALAPTFGGFHAPARFATMTLR